MAKQYVVTEADFERLLANLDRDPSYGTTGGSSAVLSEAEQEAHIRAHGFFNYHIRKWVSEVKQ